MKYRTVVLHCKRLEGVTNSMAKVQSLADAMLMRVFLHNTLLTCDDYPELLELMRHDKKNTAGTINFTLLGGIGDIRINQTATKEEIEEAMDFLREG